MREASFTRDPGLESGVTIPSPLWGYFQLVYLVWGHMSSSLTWHQ